MRTARVFLGAAIAMGVWASPITAAYADGGTYIALRTASGSSSRHAVFVPGTALVGTANLWLKGKAQQGLQHGPFEAYLVPEGTSFQPGHPLPIGAVAVGVFQVRHRSGPNWVATVHFVLPAFASGQYWIDVCDVPCTVQGFGVYASGWFQVVQTEEARKLVLKGFQQDQRIYALRRDIRNLTNQKETAYTALFDANARGVQVSNALGVESLRARAAEQAAAAARARAHAANVRAAWLAAIAVAFATLFVATLAVALKRRGRVVVPDTPAELLELAERDS